MADLYGVDVAGLEDIADPEVLVSEDTTVAFSLARRLMQDSDALEEIGDLDEYDSINLNDWLGGDFDLTDRAVLDDLQQQATAACLKDRRARTLTVQAFYTTGTLTVEVNGQGADGPFGFVLSIDGVSAPTFRVVT
jgi:hypothetical protein